MSSRSALEIKGVRNGLLVHVRPDDEWIDFVRTLVTQIDRQREFFKGAQLALELGERTVRRQELSTLQHMLAQRDVKLWAVLSRSATTLSTAHKLALQTTLDQPAPEPPPAAGEPGITETLLRVGEEDQAAAISPDEAGTSGVLVKRTLRSGRTIRSDGHVVVIGDVNPGAEIVAGGDVIIWGRLRGMVHAGAQGDEGATVCALDMTPVQLRIAGHIATSPKDQKRVPRPEIAMVRDNRIVVEAWH